MVKKILGGIAALLVVLLAGFIWGTIGKSALGTAVEQLEIRSDLLEGRGLVLAARVDVYNTNFGDSSRNLEDAHAAVERAVQRLRASGSESDAKQLEAALTPIRDAQQLAGRLDLGANSRAAEAVRIVDGVLQNRPRS